MIIRTRLWIALSFLLSWHTAFAVPEENPDSLRQIAFHSDVDTSRVRALLALAEHFTENDRDSAFYYVGIAEKNSRSIQWKKGIAEAALRKGLIHRANNEIELAKTAMNEAIRQFTEIADGSGQADALRRMAFLYNTEGDYPQAEQYYLRAEIIARKSGDEVLLAKIYSGLSGLYRLMGIYERSIQFGLEAMSIQERMKDWQGLGYTMDRLGVVYKLMEDYPLALRYFHKTLSLRETQPDSKYKDIAYSAMIIAETLIAMDSLTLAGTYLMKARNNYDKANNKEGIGYVLNHQGDIAYRLGKYNEAAEYLNKAIELFQAINNNRGLINAYYFLAQVMIGERQLEKAASLVQKLLVLAEEINSVNHIANAAYLSYTIAEMRGQYKAALAWHVKWAEHNYALWNEQKGRDIARLESKHTLAHQEREKQAMTLLQERLESDLSRQRWILLLLVGFLLTLIGLIFLQFKNAGIKKRHLEQLTKVNEALQQKSSLLEEARQKLHAMNENLELEVQFRTEELRFSNEKLEKFAYMVSHDLKQPLNTIRGFAQLMMRNAEKPQPDLEKNKESLQYINSGVQYMNQLIDDTLRLGRFTETDGNKFQKIRLLDVLTQVENNLQREIRDRGVKLQFNIPPVELTGVRAKVEHLLLILIRHILTQIQGDSEHIIEISGQCVDDSVELTLRNLEVHLPPITSDQLKDTVLTSIEKRNSLTKISLAICRKIAAQHGGSLTVQRLKNSTDVLKVTLRLDPSRHLDHTSQSSAA